MLTLSNMHIYTFESDIAFHLVLLVLKPNMMAFFALIFLAVAKVHHEDFILLFSKSHHKVIRFNVVVDQTLRMNPLDPIQYLVSDKKNSLEAEGSFAVLKQLFERGAEDICN